MSEGVVCISKSYSDIQLYANTKLDARAFLDKTSAPLANEKSDGKTYSSMGVNVALLVEEKSQQFPMYRANVDNIIILDKKSLKSPTKYVEFLIGNPNTKAGTILAANFNGKMIGEYYNVVGTPSANGVKFGAIYSPAAEDLVGLKSSQPK